MVGKTSLNTDAHGWTWIVRNNKQETLKHIRNPFQKDVERIATSFFITNFPKHIDANGLWKVCESCGCIVDAFIANKRSKARKMFGFVRVVGIQNEEAFAKSLSSIWIGSFHLFASVARFQIQKTVVENPKKETIKVVAPVLEKHAGKIESGFSYPKHSYVSVLNSRRGTIEAKTTMAMKSISLSNNELVNIVNSMEVALVKVKSVEIMSTMYRLCREEGFDIVKIHHVGRLWLWLQFQNVDSFWVEISGLPLCAWGSNVFKKVANSVGKFMFFEDDRSTAMSMGRVYITTKQLEFISEVVKVAIHGEEDKVEKVDDDKCEMENNKESNQSNTPQEMNGEEQKEARPDEDIEKDDSDWSRSRGFKQFKNTGACSYESSLQSKWIGEKLRYDVKGCHISLHGLIDGIGVIMARMVKAIHGDDIGMELKGCKFSGTWANIVDSFSMLHSKDIIPLHTLRHKVGNGWSIRFWKDNWIDSWHWNGADDGVFSVNVTHLHVDNCILPSLIPSTRWSMILPLYYVPSCNVGLESNDHIFFGCDTASSIWRIIRVWIDVSMPSFVSCSDWLQWLDDWGSSKDYKDRVYVISVTALWIL
ncbi:RNA-directed DNA polymerase, eukaryota [Tanacetum coccineum]